MARASNGKSVINGEIVSVTVDDTSKASRLAIRRKGELTRKLISNNEKLNELAQKFDEKQTVVTELLEQKETDYQLEQLEATVTTQESQIVEKQSEIDELDMTILALLKKC